MKIIGLVTVFFVCSISTGDSTWSAVIETGEDFLYGLRDCAFLSNGSTVISFVGPFEDPFLICSDPDGSVLWYRHVLEKGGTSRAFESNGDLVTLKDGFAVCYHSEPRATGINTDIAVARLDSSGEILWTYILGKKSNANWMSTDMISCSDGGLLVSGCPGAQVPGGFVFKLSAEGGLEWMTQPKEIAGFALSVTQTDEGDFIVLVNDEYSNGIVVQHISGNGLVSDPVIVSGLTIPFNAEINLFNEYYWIHSAADSYDNRVYRMDLDCSGLHEIVIQLSMDSRAELTDIVEEGLLLAGGTDDGKALLMLYDFNGNLLWQRYYGTDGRGFLSSAVFSDHGIMAAGNISMDSGEEYSFWLLKTDRSGLVEGAGITGNDTLKIEPERMHIELSALGWVMACAVVNSEAEAVRTSRDLTEITSLQTGYLWIPDWQSLSGVEGWLVYARSYMEHDGILQESIDSLLEIYPDAYFVWASQGWERKTMTIDDFFSS